MVSCRAEPCGDAALLYQGLTRSRFGRGGSFPLIVALVRCLFGLRHTPCGEHLAARPVRGRFLFELSGCRRFGRAVAPLAFFDVLEARGASHVA